jgi:hypothetical protein
VASFTITAAPWPAGTSVGVYDARSWMNTAAAPPGAPLGGGVVTLAGTVAFTGLADNTRYVAFADGVGVRFATAVPGLHQSVAVPDRERIKLLEDQVAAGGGGGGGGTGGLDLYTVDTNEHFKVIGLSNGTVTAIPFDVHPPAVPTGLVAAVKVTSVRLDWNGVAGAARYPIARDGVQIAAPEVRNYRDTTVTIGSTHAYQVATEDAYGQRSGYGPAVSAFIDPALNTAPTIEIRTWPPAIPTNGTALLRVNATDTDAETLALALSIDRGNLAPTDDPSLWIVTV